MVHHWEASQLFFGTGTHFYKRFFQTVNHSENCEVRFDVMDVCRPAYNMIQSHKDKTTAEENFPMILGHMCIRGNPAMICQLTEATPKSQPFQTNKSEGFDHSCDQPYNLTQIGFKFSIFSICVTSKFDGWPWKTIRHLFCTTSSFVHHFKALSHW